MFIFLLKNVKLFTSLVVRQLTYLLELQRKRNYFESLKYFICIINLISWFPSISPSRIPSSTPTTTSQQALGQANGPVNQPSNHIMINMCQLDGIDITTFRVSSLETVLINSDLFVNYNVNLKKMAKALKKKKLSNFHR